MADQTTTTAPPDWLQQYWQNDYLNPMMNLTANPIPVYGGPTVAPWNQNQNTAANMMYGFATNGTPTGNAANGAIIRQANGVSNPYAGNNPYLQSVINNSNADIAKAYATGTAAQTDAAAARAGAYGGSGYNEMVGLNQKNLAQQLAQNTSNLQYQNYLNSGNLFEQDQNRQLQAASLGPASQGADLSAMNGLFNVGTAQQGNTQSNLDAMRNLFTQQVQAPFTTLDLRGNALSRVNGGSVQTINGPGTSPAAYAGLIPIFASIISSFGNG